MVRVQPGFYLSSSRSGQGTCCRLRLSSFRVPTRKFYAAWVGRHRSGNWFASGVVVDENVDKAKSGRKPRSGHSSATLVTLVC